MSGMTLQRLARRSGVSVGHLSKLETGQVRRPEVSTLLAVARGLGLQPEPLLAAAGHLDLSATRELLARLLRPHATGVYDGDGDSDVTEEWEHLGWDAPAARALALDEETPAVEIRALAARVFPTARGRGGAWVEALSEAGDDPELAQVLQAWPRLAPRQRRLVAEVAETLRNPGIECTGAGRDPR